MSIFKVIATLLLLMANNAYANKTSIYFSEVLSIDKNNIMTVLKDGKKRLIKFAYLRTPIKGEFKNDVVHQYLTDTLLNKWVRISELSGSGRAKVYRAIVRDDKQKIVNVMLASKGFGVPVKIEQPPLSIFEASKIANKQKKGIWENHQKFETDRNESIGKSFLAQVEEMKTTLKNQKNPNHQFYVGNKITKTFSPIKCSVGFTKENMVVFATKYVGLNRKYTYIPCPTVKGAKVK